MSATNAAMGMSNVPSPLSSGNGVYPTVRFAGAPETVKVTRLDVIPIPSMRASSITSPNLLLARLPL